MNLIKQLLNKAFLKSVVAAFLGDAAEREIKKRLAFNDTLKDTLKLEGLTDPQVSRIEPLINGYHAHQVTEWIEAKIEKI